MKKIIIAIFGAILMILLMLIIIRLLGYEYNKEFVKEYLSFNKRECIEQEYPTYVGHSGIQGCLFWMRENYLQEIQSWRILFKRDDEYCNQKYTKESSAFENLLSGEYSDPKCEYEAFRKQKRDENWAYLVSKEKDGFYDYCIDQACPSPKIFK